jgi:hypothetical protein
MIFALVLMPVVWPILYLRIRELPVVAERLGSPNVRAWDEIFARRTECWVIVRLKDQRQIGGLYGPKSFASRSPAAPEIFLEQVWLVDGNGGFTGTMAESTSGILIMGTEILAVEFYRYNWMEVSDAGER